MKNFTPRISTLLSFVFIASFAFAQIDGYQGTPYGGEARTIPGKIEAEDFDNGGQNVAYYDDDDENRGGFRTDESVDVHAHIYDVTDGTNQIGWFHDGEWLRYTVNVEPGTYTFTARVGCPESDRSMMIMLDEELLTIMPIGNTGSYAIMENQEHGPFEISQGGNGKVLTLIDVNDDFDFNWFRFDKVGSTGTSKLKNQSEINVYPNPAKDDITISNLSPNSAISVYCLSGNKVLESKNENNSELKIGLTNFKPGVYFIQVTSGLNNQCFKVVKE